MNVSVYGEQNTGKTRLINELQKRLPDFDFVETNKEQGGFLLSIRVSALNQEMQALVHKDRAMIFLQPLTPENFNESVDFACKVLIKEH